MLTLSSRPLFGQCSLKAQLLCWAFFYSIFLSGCSHTPHWPSETLETQPFALYTEAPLELKISPSNPLTIVIEGDGYAWVTRSRPSSDPTPKGMTAREMAYHLPNAVYLARPCQYVWSKSCSPLYWTSGRFHLKVVESLEQGLDRLKARYHAKTLRLIGYSGGGVLAGIIAARRQDVVEWVSVASPLDEAAWTSYHQVSFLEESISLKEYQTTLLKMPQIHYVGGDDVIVPWIVDAGWVAAMKDNPRVIWHVIPGYRHDGDWAKMVR